MSFVRGKWRRLSLSQAGFKAKPLSPKHRRRTSAKRECSIIDKTFRSLFHVTREKMFGSRMTNDDFQLKVGKFSFLSLCESIKLQLDIEMSKGFS